MDNEAQSTFGIWYPYEVFYLESMLTITRAAMVQQSALRSIVESGPSKTGEHDDLIIDLVQNFLQNCAAVSRYFWPSGMNKSRLKLAQPRAEVLKRAFKVTEDSPLNDRAARNLVEHFDESLDSLLAKPIAGAIFPKYVGNRPTDAPQFFFRAYFIDDNVFKVLDLELSIAPMVNELIRVHLLLEQFIIDGGRLPRT